MCKKWYNEQVRSVWGEGPKAEAQAPQAEAPAAPAPVPAAAAPVRGVDADSGAIIKKDVGGDPNNGSDIFSVDKKKKRRLGVPGLGI